MTTPPHVPDDLDRRARRARAAARSRGAGLAGAPDHGHGSVRRGQFARHRRAHRDGPAVDAARPDHCDREPRRRRRLDRHGSVAKADPDGYTLLIQASAHSAAPAAYPNLSYDPVARLLGGDSVRHDPERHGRASGPRLQDGAGSRRGRAARAASSLTRPRASAAPPIGRRSGCGSPATTTRCTSRSKADRRR